MEYLICRFVPGRDARPRMRRQEVAPQPTDPMLLDALERIRIQEDSLAFRRSCREGGMRRGRHEHQRPHLPCVYRAAQGTA